MRTRERPSRPHRGLEVREIGARDQIGDGIIEFWVDAESEIFDFRGLDDRTSIEHLSNSLNRHRLGYFDFTFALKIKLKNSLQMITRFYIIKSGGSWPMSD